MSEDNKPPRPGEAALQNMKLLKNESTVFKVPKVPKKKAVKKTEVLDEDIYTEGIAKIIQRDFFPDLEKLKAQNEYLEAKENKDYVRLQEIARKYSGMRPPTEPYNSPATFDTPEVGRPYSPSAPTVRGQRPETVDESTSDKSQDIIDKHTLDSFLATHTSEDNASYDRIIALEDKKRSTKLASQFEAERKALEDATAALALPSIEDQADQTKRPDELATWTYRARNFIMYVPDGANRSGGERAELVHANTRLRAPPFDPNRSRQAISEIARSQDLSVSGKIGVDGMTVSGDKPAESQYPLVEPPSPATGAGPDASPLMTWGAIEGTPLWLDGEGTPLPAVGAGAAYRMLEGGKRERIAMQLCEQAARRRRPTTPRLAHTPSFRTNTERLASMSPAARKLAAKHLLSPRLKLTPMDMGIFHTATPKRTPTPSRKLIATPKKVSTPRNTANITVPPVSASETDNLTDNLLNISVAKRTRLKAQDFFKSST